MTPTGIIFIWGELWGYGYKLQTCSKRASARAFVCRTHASRSQVRSHKHAHEKTSPEGLVFSWGELWGSNPRPSEPQPDALTN